MNPGGIEDDPDIRIALDWLSSTTENASLFTERLAYAQQAYRQFTASAKNLGKDPKLTEFHGDIVASYFAQPKSLLDDRRSYDLALCSKIIPWIKQLGRNVAFLNHVVGARERAVRMLNNHSVLPDSAMFELVTASNYAAAGFKVAFIQEAKGQARTPDFKISLDELSKPIFVECKRLGCGQYEQMERERHGKIFGSVAKLINAHELSVHIDVTYTRELQDIPETYLFNHLKQMLESRVLAKGGYPWKDELGYGEVRHANLDAVQQDVRDSSLYFGTKLARLLSRRVVRETNYHLTARGKPDYRDPRFMDAIYYGSVVTWQSVAHTAIERKSRFVKSKLVEADRQLQGYGPSIAHLAMDAGLECVSSDLSRARNIEMMEAFVPKSMLLATYVHYLMPRISEAHSWLVDETVDAFGQTIEPVPIARIFASSTPLENDLPAWKQQLKLP